MVTQLLRCVLRSHQVETVAFWSLQAAKLAAATASCRAASDRQTVPWSGIMNMRTLLLRLLCPHVHRHNVQNRATSLSRKVFISVPICKPKDMVVSDSIMNIFGCQFEAPRCDRSSSSTLFAICARAFQIGTTELRLPSWAGYRRIRSFPRWQF